MKRKLRLFFVAVMATLTLAACGTNSNEPPEKPDANGYVNVNWVQINPPPGVEGPCFAFFLTKDQEFNSATSFSGVHCEPGK